MVGDEHIDGSPMPMTVSVSNHAAKGGILANRFFFEVPFEQNDAAKAAGLRWDSASRKWYAATAEIAKAFSRSVEVGTATPAQTDRFYFKVPFIQKDRAKAMGMRFDGIRKLWFAPNQTLAIDAARIFENA